MEGITTEFLAEQLFTMTIMGKAIAYGRMKTDIEEGRVPQGRPQKEIPQLCRWLAANMEAGNEKVPVSMLDKF